MQTQRNLLLKLGVTGLLFSSASILAAQPASNGLTAAVPEEESAATRIPRAGAPNVLVWMIDDVGFGQVGCFGGLVETPNLDRLAQRGLRYTNYHTTPICSASRAAFLMGRNSHSLHMGSHVAIALPFAGYDGKIPASAGTIAENLRQDGYVTYALGKWDHMPLEDMSAAGPFTYWPSNQGFDRFYGFLAADTDNFRPQLWSDHTPITLPHDPQYHLSADLADRAIDFIQSRNAVGQRPPFFLYWATGAAHAPHHAPDAYLEKYRGKFDIGWDKAREEVLARQIELGVVPKDTKLPPRPDSMPAWDSLTPVQKRTYARAMEAFAAALSYADFEFGRIIATLERNGELDNTLIIATSDNGASSEGAHEGTYNEALFVANRQQTAEQNAKYYEGWGKAETFPNYPIGWALAGNTPFRYYKFTAYEGGTHVPFVISWPKEIKAMGEVRRQYTFVADVAPTIMEAAKVTPAALVHNVPQSPWEGLSFAYSFDATNAPSRRTTQYYEMFGNRSIFADGWKAVVPHRLDTWDMNTPRSFAGDHWELYNIRADINERNDLAATNPAQLAKLQGVFAEQGKLYNVIPLHDVSEGVHGRIARSAKQFADHGGVWSYPAPVLRVPGILAPPIINRSYSMSAKVTLSRDGASGPIWVLGGRYGGVSLELDAGRPILAYRDNDLSLVEIAGTAAISTGLHMVNLTVTRGENTVAVDIAVDGTTAAHAEIASSLVPVIPLNEDFDIGKDEGSGVRLQNIAPTTFPGTIADVRFDFRLGASGNKKVASLGLVSALNSLAP